MKSLIYNLVAGILAVAVLLPICARASTSGAIAAQELATPLGAEEKSGGCSWTGPSPEWVLARHPPVGEISGSLSAKVVPFLRHSGIPISLIMKEGSYENLQLHIDATTTTEDVLEEIERQLPEYRYAVVSRHIVVYPNGDEYDAPVELSSLSGVTRAMALFPLLRELRVKASAFKSLDLPVLRGAGHKTLYRDTVEVGGRRTAVEHLVSLIQKRPTIAFSVLPQQNGHLAFGFFLVPLVKTMVVEIPPAVALGETFQATAKAILSDDSAVSLDGPECYLEYAVSGRGELEIDDVGRVVTRKRGVAGVIVRYEDKSDFAKLEVY